MANEAEIIASNILSSAIEYGRLYDTTKKNEYREKEQRLRRIAENIKLLTGSSSTSTVNSFNGRTGAINLLSTDVTGALGYVPGIGDMTKAVYDTDNDGIVDNAEMMSTLGRNSTGSTLYKGTIVYISGSTGNRPNFVKAQANSEATSAGTFGVVIADIPNNTDGSVATIGTLNNLDTRSTATNPFTDVTLADGDTLYLHPTIAGYVTNVKPSAPNHLVYVGKVVRTHPTLGTIVYRIQNGYELEELHNVAISSVANNDLLVYESATSLWKNKTIAAIFGGTPLVAVPTLDQVTTAGNTTTNSINVGKITTTGSITASAALAQGSYFNNTLVAAANNDVLVGLDINPTITLGAFTGIKSYGLRIVGDNLAFQPSTTTKIPIFVTSNNNTRIIISSTATGTSFNTGFSLTQGSTYKWSFASYGTNADFVFYNDVTSTNSLFITGNTNNVLINSTTDAGYKLDVNGTARVQTTLTAGQNSGTSYNHLFDAGLGGITFRRYDSYVTSNFITITQPNYGTSANGSMLYIDSPSKASGFATLKLAGPYNGGGSTYLQVGNASTITSTHVSLAKFHTGNLQYIGPTYGGSNTFMGLDIRVEGQTADYSVSTTTNFVGIYVQSSFLNKYSTTQLPIGSWKTFVDNSTLTNIVTPFTSIDITPTFTSASNTVTSYGININPTLNGYIGFIALNVQQGKVITNSSITASSALAQGVYFNNTLVAAANNDVLVGLDINPTFTNGAFTGVSNYGLRVKGDDVNGSSAYSLYAYGGQVFIKGNFSINAGYNLIVQNRAGLNSLRVQGTGLVIAESFAVSDGGNKGFTVSYSGSGGYQFGLAVTDTGVAFTNGAAASRPVSFSMNTGEILRIHQSYTSIVTNNFLIGTTTDAGYKLDVNGTGRFSGNLEVNAGSNGRIFINNVYPQLLFGKTGTPSWSLFADTENAGQFEMGRGAGYPYNSFVRFLYVGTDGKMALGGNASASGTKLLLSGSVTAQSALGVGTSVTQTITAAANNDILVGLDINPTFTNGAFTGVSNIALRVTGTGLFTSTLTANSFVKSGGTSSQFLKADGSVDSTVYLSSVPSLQQVTTAGNSTSNAISTVGITVNSYMMIDASSTFMGIIGFNRNISNGNILNGTYSAYQVQNEQGVFKIQAWNTSGGLTTTHSFFSSGNVGISTLTDAGYKLDVNGTGRFSGSLTATLASATTSNVVYYNSTTGLFTYGAAPSGGGGVSGSGTTNYIPKFTASTTLGNSVIYDTGTNVLIGTTTDAGYKLDVNGTTRIVNNFYVTSGKGVFGLDASSLVPSALVRLQTMTPASASYPTLGTASGAFMVAGDITNYGLFMGVDTISGNAWMQAMRTDAVQAYHIILQTVGGNVGIAKNAPAYRLDVVGDINTSTQYRINGTVGFTGTFTVLTNPVGQRNLNISGGIITSIT